MRIVQINTTSHKSTGTIMFHIHKLLLEKGHESYVIWGRGREPQSPYEYSIYDNIGVWFHGTYTRLFDKTGFASWAATRKLIVILEEIKPDIIHLHNLHGYYLNIDILFRYLKSKKINIVWTLHDCWAFTGHCVYFSAIGCSKWKTGCNHCPQTKAYPASIGIDNSQWNWRKKKELYENLRLYMVTVSKWLNDMLPDSILGQYPSKTIYNGLEMEVFAPCESDVQCDIRRKFKLDDRFIILGVADGWVERKGLMDFVRLSKELDNRYQIILVGLTEKQMKSIEDTSIRGMKRTGCISKLVELYSVADVFLNLSVEETMGMTTVEAMACGIPAIVYNCTALPEILSDFPENIIEPHNILELKKAINRIRLSPKSKKIYRKAVSKYEATLKFEEYIELYHFILEGKQAYHSFDGIEI